MSTAAPARTWATTALRYLPGLLLLLAVGVVGTFAQTGLRAVATATGTRLPDIEYVLWAIVLGLIIRNTVGVPAIFRPGVATYEFWLKIGIVLLGARFLLGDLAKLGGFSFQLIIIDMAVATTVIILVGHLFGLGGKLSTLLAVGTSICGVSAIIAGKGAIDADDEDSGYAIAAILALGAVALFTFPAIGHALQLTDTPFGLWAGRAGVRPLVVAALGLVVVAACSLGLVLLTSGWHTPVGR